MVQASLLLHLWPDGQLGPEDGVPHVLETLARVILNIIGSVNIPSPIAYLVSEVLVFRLRVQDEAELVRNVEVDVDLSWLCCTRMSSNVLKSDLDSSVFVKFFSLIFSISFVTTPLIWSLFLNSCFQDTFSNSTH